MAVQRGGGGRRRGVYAPPNRPGERLAWMGGDAGECHAMLSLISRPHFLQVVWARDCYAHVTLRGLVPCSRLAVP